MMAANSLNKSLTCNHCASISSLKCFLEQQNKEKWTMTSMQQFSNWLSPTGRSSLLCCRCFGVPLSDIGHITKSFVWACYRSMLIIQYCRTVHVLLELLFVKFGYFSVFCSSQSDVAYVPSVLWRCWLGGRKGIRPVKNWVVGCWHGYLSRVSCRFAYGPADATATHYLLLQ